MTGDLKVGIKIQADADAAREALRDTADALADIGRKADPAKDIIDDLGQGIEHAGAKARTAGGAIGSMVDELAPIGKLALGINEVAELLGRIGGQAAELMSVADAYKQMAARLELATGSAEAAGVALESVRATAAATGADLESVASLYGQLATASKDLGLTESQVAALTGTVSKSFAVSGASAAEASGAMRQFAQALAFGVLREDEFKMGNRARGLIES